jgi:cobalt-zinc-cadmium efflux system membrane fusion protein
MNLRSGVLGIGVIFIVSFFLSGRVTFSEDDHSGHDHGLNTSSVRQENNTESDRDKHEHRVADPDEESDHAAHVDHGETDERVEKRSEEHDHDEHDQRESDPGEDPDHEGHDHGAKTGTVDDGDGHVEDDDDGVLELTEAQQRGIGLSLVQAGPGSLYNELSLMGEIRLNEDRVAHVVPKVSGVVRSVAASLGNEVKIEQILATIESAELAESKANYLEKMRQLEIAKKAYKRKKYLRKEKIASEAGWLEKEAAYLNAETALKSARRRLVVSGVTEEEILVLQDATAQFGLYMLRAPISGTVIEKHITMGEKLDDDSKIFTIADLTELWVDLKIPSRDMSQVKQGTTVVIQSSDSEKATGTIFLIGPVVDKATRTGLARLLIDNMDGQWKPGTFVTGFVRLVADNLPVVVSAEAVQNIEGKNVIFVPEDHGFRPVSVIAGRRDRTRVEIVSGLKAGTSYVTQGAFELKAMMITSSLGSHAGHGH